MVDVNLSPAELERQLKDKKWENAQIKGLTSWANTYLSKESLEIKELPADVSDGVRLAVLLENLSGDRKIAGLVRKPKHKVEKLQNSSILLKFATDQLGIRLVGIGAEDIVNGELKMILGLMWTTFRKIGLSSLGNKSGRGTNPEEDLLGWVRDRVSPYGVDVVSFRSSFNDGRAWAALIDQFDPEYLKFESLNPADREGTLNAVFDAAEKHMGIPKLLDVKDLLDDTADERSVTLYTSLFYHTFVTNADQIKLANEKRGLTHTAADVESQLRSVRSAIDGLRADHVAALELRRSHERDVEASDARLKALQADVDAMRREKADLERRLRELQEQRTRNLRKDLAGMYEERDALKNRGSENVEQRLSMAAESLRRSEELDRLMRRMRSAGLMAGASSSGSADGLDEEQSASGIGRVFCASELDALRASLRGHLNGLYHKWDALAAKSEDGSISASRQTFQAEQKVRVGTLPALTLANAKKRMEEAVQAEFRASHETMTNILAVRDARAEMNRVVVKRGFLVAQEDGKRWKKRWFVLRGFQLDYFESKEEQDDEPAGSINLEDSMVASIDSKDSKVAWVVKLTTTVEGAGGEKRKEVLQVAAKSKDDRDDWFFVLQSLVLYTHYLALVKKQHVRPDARILALFEKRTFASLVLDHVPLDALALKVVEKLVAGHAECVRFSLAGAALTDEAMHTLSAILQHRDSVVGINLAHNAISSAGVENLLEGIQLADLQELDLSHNSIDDSGVLALCGVLAVSADLTRLDLSHNRLEGSCLEELTHLYKDCVGLNEIHLGHNRIDDAAVAKLAPLLQFTESVAALDLSHNRIGDEGILSLCDALRTNSVVRSVDVRGNVFGSAGLAAIHRLLLDNQGLSVLTTGNHLGVLSEPAEFVSIEGVLLQELSLTRF